jgi:hypothetical protein
MLIRCAGAQSKVTCPFRHCRLSTLRTIIMASIRMILLGFISLLPIAVRAQQDVIGMGFIMVVNSSDIFNASPADRIGCLNDAGRFTLNDNCGLFSHDDSSAPLYTSLGVCSFQDPSKEANTDSEYGRGDHAFSCGYAPANNDTFYTIVRPSLSERASGC